MKIIISPAKKMNIENDLFAAEGLPCFREEAETLLRRIRSLSFEEVQKLWACNDKLAHLNFRRFQEMDLEKNLTPAILSFDGIQYRHMAPRVFSQGAWEYVQKHLRILSGFYGVLKPLDGVIPYRLEMQARLGFDGYKNLYEFWGSKLYEQAASGGTIINLASKEYSRCVKNYLKPGDRFITCVFGEWKDGKVIQKGTRAKMARGDMVRFMAESQVLRPEEIKKFDSSDYAFCEERSSESEYVFLKKEDSISQTRSRNGCFCR